MATYYIKGARFLRMFTASKPTPTYAAETDAANIVDQLCDVAWQRVSVKDATMTSHSNEKSTRDSVEKTGLDWNVDDRQSFDAAVWCSNHTGGNHTAYANAACYVYALPTMATYPNITSVKVRATSDPYNVSGLRIAVATSDTLAIPTACSTCRTGSFYAEGVAPHRVDSTTGSWYPKTEEETLTPSATVALKKYLFIFVLKEDYGETRGNWLEGSGFIKNLVTLTTSAAVTGWTDGDTIDCSEDSSSEVEVTVCKDGVVPDTDGTTSSVIYVNCLSSGTQPVQDDNHYVTNIAQVNDELTPDNSYMGVQTAYALLAAGEAAKGAAALSHANNKRLGVGFAVRQNTDIKFRAGADSTAVAPRSVALTASSLCVPFTLPKGFVADKMVIDYALRFCMLDSTGSSVSMQAVAYGGGRFVALANGTLYAMGEDDAAWTSLGSIDSSLNKVVYGNGRFVLMSSSNGTSYQLVDGSTTLVQMGSVSEQCDSVAYGNGRFLAMSSGDTSSTYCCSYLEDGSTTWVQISGAGMYFMNLAYGNGRFVGGSLKKWYAMNDGETAWTALSDVSNNISQMAYGSGRFVACAGSCAYYLSDGSTTFVQMSVDSTYLNLVAYGSGMFLLLDAAENAFELKDGETSFARIDNEYGDTSISICYGNGRFVVGGYHGSSAIVPVDDGGAMKVAVWMKEGYTASVDDDTLKDPSLYFADESTVGGWSLVGVFDAMDLGATFDMPAVSARDVSLLFAPFVDITSVPDTTDNFNIGAINFRYNGLSADVDVTVSSAVKRLYGSDNLIMPNVKLIGQME